MKWIIQINISILITFKNLNNFNSLIEKNNSIQISSSKIKEDFDPDSK
jgi:hypothetical protein